MLEMQFEIKLRAKINYLDLQNGLENLSQNKSAPYYGRAFVLGKSCVFIFI